MTTSMSDELRAAVEELLARNKDTPNGFILITVDPTQDENSVSLDYTMLSNLPFEARDYLLDSACTKHAEAPPDTDDVLREFFEELLNHITEPKAKAKDDENERQPSSARATMSTLLALSVLGALMGTPPPRR